MAYPASPALPLTDRQRKLLEQHVRKLTASERAVFRCRVILNGADGVSDERSAARLSKRVLAIKKWRKRWLAGYDQLLGFEQGVDGQGVTDRSLLREMLCLLADLPRSGRPKEITEAQEQQIVALSCEKPATYGLAVSTWTQALLAQKVVELGILPSISAHHVGVILKKKCLKPHKDEYWLFPTITDWPAFVATVNIICATIKESIAPSATGQPRWRLISCDEKTGIQALQRRQQRLPDERGGHLRQEFEYTRHGTLTLIAGIDVASGRLLHHTIGPTCNEEDYWVFIEQQVSQLEPDEEVIFLMDQLNTHKSASLVKWVAGQIGFTESLGRKGKHGILKNQQSRMAFLEKTDHPIRFLFTPKHCSWLNPIENWFARLARSALKSLSVESLAELTQKINAYIDYYSDCLAKPFDWKSDGFSLNRPLYSYQS